MKNNDIIKNIVTSILQQLVTVICGFIAPRLIIATYGSNINGMITSITQFLGYITLLEAGISPVVKAALYKPIANCDKEKIEKILKSAEYFFRTIAVIFVCYLAALSIIFPNVYIKEYSFTYTFSLVLIIAVSTLFEYFFGMTYTIYLQAAQKNYVVSLIKIALKILNTLAVVILTLNDCSIQVVKLISSLIFVMSPLILNFYVKKKFNINLKGIKYKEIKDVLQNKWAGFSQHVAAIIHNSVDVAVLTFFSNPLEVSVYSVYMLVINSINDLAVSLSGGIDSWFGNLLAKGDNKTLNENLKLYEFFYFSIVAILFACTMSLELPFVKVYTAGITDVDYIRPTFAYIMIFAELVMAIRIPYNSIVLSAGHFKQTQFGAWIEAGLNVSISCILVKKYGIVGVAVGTLIAMLYRTTEYIIYSSKNILKRSAAEAFGKALIVFIEIGIVFVLSRILPFNYETTYLNFLINAIFVGIISVVIVGLGGFIVYKNEMRQFIFSIKRRVKKHE